MFNATNGRLLRMYAYLDRHSRNKVHTTRFNHASLVYFRYDAKSISFSFDVYKMSNERAMPVPFVKV